MIICSVYGHAHHWDEERVEGGTVNQRCACGAGRSFQEEPESAAEEMARLIAESDARDELIAARVADIEEEGIGDGLRGALVLLLNPGMVPAERQASEIASHVLRLIAQRDLAKQSALDGLARIDRVEVIDGSGRAFTGRYSTVGASLLVQDDGCTLKVLTGGRAL